MIDLLHEVSLCSTSNKMNSYNLAVILTPNLIKSSNPIEDVQLCTFPHAPTWSESNTTTLVQIIQICIEWYSEALLSVPPRHSKVSRV